MAQNLMNRCQMPSAPRHMAVVLILTAAQVLLIDGCGTAPCMLLRGDELPSGGPDIFSRAPLQRQILSATKVVRTDGTFSAHSTYPNPRKRKATVACGDGYVGGNSQSCE